MRGSAVAAFTLLASMASTASAMSIFTGPFYLRFGGDSGSAKDRAQAMTIIGNDFDLLPDSGVYFCSTSSERAVGRAMRREVRESLIRAGAPKRHVFDGGECDSRDTGRSRADTPPNSVLVIIAPSRDDARLAWERHRKPGVSGY